MFLTVFYAAATWVQSWRLSSIKSRILQLTSQNGTVVFYKVPDPNSEGEGGGSAPIPSVSSHFCENVGAAKLGDLLWNVDNKRLCSVFPKQKICATRWISFSSDPSQFPITVAAKSDGVVLSENRLNILLEADFQEVFPGTLRNLTAAEFCQLEEFGILKAWKAGETFGVLLESDAEHLTRLGLSFMQSCLSLEDGMELLRIQTVDVDGHPCPLLNADSIPVPRSLQRGKSEDQSDFEGASADITGIVQPPAAWLLMSPIQWRSHVELLRSFSTAVEEAEGTSTSSSGLVLASDRTPKLIPVENKAPLTPPSTPDLSRHRKINGTNKQTEGGLLSPTYTKDLPPTNSEPYELSVKSSGVTSHSESFYSCASHDMAKLSESLEQLNKALESISDEHSNGHSMEEKDAPSALPAITKSPASSLKSLDCKRPFKGSTASLPPSVTPRSRSPSSPVRFPNVLVFSDSTNALEQVKLLLKQTLKKYRYTVYNVTAEQLKGSGWQSTTALVIVCGSVPEAVATMLVSYLLQGGKILCLCSDLLHTILPEYRTAEVRTNELVTFSYQRWKKIKMLHHVFCYQPSPVHSKFGERQSSKGVTPSAAIELRDCQGAAHKLDIAVLGVEETWHTPSLILAKVSGSGGKIVFSQVHLEVDPLQYESDNTTFSSLKQSNTARLDIMRDILGTQLLLECCESSKEEAPTTAFFLGRHELKLEFLGSVKSRLGPNGDTLGMDNMVLQICGKNTNPGQLSASFMPIMLHSCPPHFNTVEYFDNLKTDHIGRLLVYADVMSSSMEVVTGAPLWHGLAAVPRQQLKGKGRGSNEWLSPEGCGMFTLQIMLPLHSNLGRRLSLLQHLAALAIVLAIREAPGYEEIDLRLKWPNDIYAGDWAKVGGLIVNSSVIGKQVVCNIGCGINLSNSEPTTCIHDLLKDCASKAPPMSLERYLALTFSRLESLIDAAQNSDDGLADILKIYYAYWLHSGAEVTVLSEDGKKQRCKIQGLDDFGFLSVRGDDGKSFSVHPDGNCFDMLQGLIKPKT